VNERFRIINANQLPTPSRCSCCGSGDRDCVDWGFTEFMGGAVMLCTVCFKEAMLLLFPLDPVEAVVKQQQKDVEEIYTAVKELNDELGITFGLFLSRINGIGARLSAKQIVKQGESTGARGFNHIIPK